MVPKKTTQSTAHPIASVRLICSASSEKCLRRNSSVCSRSECICVSIFIPYRCKKDCAVPVGPAVNQSGFFPTGKAIGSRSLPSRYNGFAYCLSLPKTCLNTTATTHSTAKIAAAAIASARLLDQLAVSAAICRASTMCFMSDSVLLLTDTSSPSVLSCLPIVAGLH